jgi:phosphate acetyltransferase
MQLLGKMNVDFLYDGELQVDAAIAPEVAKIKKADAVLGGKANILIFPNLEAGNIGYKLVERLSHGRALGPLLLGLNKPCSDLSRGCSVQDVVDCVAVTAVRAQ